MTDTNTSVRKVPILDSREEISKLDVSNAFGSIEMLGSQVKQIWEEAKKLNIDESYSHIQNVVVAGMGGSSLGTHVIQSVFKEELKVPVLIAPDYTVPTFVNQNTLVVASSYSGTTEETLAAVVDAQKKGAKIVGITSGGKLAEYLKTNNFPALIFDPIFNPCGQPRMAVGYSIFGQIALLARTGVLSITDDQYQKVLEVIAKTHLIAGVNVPQESNPAKLLAFEMLERLPVVTVAEHLEGPAHVFANQLNENAKNYSEYRVIPELNHHLMEGLQFPKSNEANLLFFLVGSDLYSASNRKRVQLTKQVLEKNMVPVQEYQLTSTTKFEQAFEMLVFGAYTNLYLAVLNNLNPSPIPWVDWFKAELKK
jgi:glucose/mannose-6-phosphate isomerase